VLHRRALVPSAARLALAALAAALAVPGCKPLKVTDPDTSLIRRWTATANSG
jgi:hypothetical protein